MAKLTAKQRNGLGAGEFALPGRKYPIEDASHARNALARAAQHASPAQKAEIDSKVHAKYPAIGQKMAKGGMVKPQRVPAKSLQTPGVGVSADTQPAVTTKAPPVNIHGVALKPPVSTHAARAARG